MLEMRIWKRFKGGFSNTEILLALGIVGVISAVVISMVLSTTSKPDVVRKELLSSHQEILKNFQAEESRRGMIPRSEEPSSVISSSLNAVSTESLTSSSVSPACQATYSAQPNADLKAFKLVDKKTVYVPDAWVLDNTTRKDYVDVCITHPQSDGVSESFRIFRSGSTRGILANASATNTTPASSTVTSTTTTTTTVGTCPSGQVFNTISNMCETTTVNTTPQYPIWVAFEFVHVPAPGTPTGFQVSLLGQSGVFHPGPIQMTCDGGQPQILQMKQWGPLYASIPANRRCSFEFIGGEYAYTHPSGLTQTVRLESNPPVDLEISNGYNQTVRLFVREARTVPGRYSYNFLNP